MEDYIIREIDRLGEMLLMIARRLGLLDGVTQDCSLTDIKDEFEKPETRLTWIRFCSRRTLSGTL